MSSSSKPNNNHHNNHNLLHQTSASSISSSSHLAKPDELLSGSNLDANLDKLVLNNHSDSLLWPPNNSNNKPKDIDNPTTNSSFSNLKPNSLDSQQQRLNVLVELISNQEAKLNRLKALRKLAKEQSAINVELNNELKTVNNSISEKDGELRQALNRVDNLNRQLNNYRRTRTYRSSKSLTPTKPQPAETTTTNQQTVANASDGGVGCGSQAEDISISGSFSISTTQQQDLTRMSSSSDIQTNNNVPSNVDEVTLTKETPPCSIPDPQDLTNTKLVNTLDKDESKPVQNINNSPALDGSTIKQIVVHSHASPALTKYTNARQKLIGSGFKDKSNGRRVSFDPLALLLDAALEGELDLVIQTSKQVPDLSASHDECVTALHNAVVAGHYEVAKFLIEAGCDINTQDSDGWTPLHCAASCNNLALVKLLVENGALIYATTTSDHSTPAMKCEQSEEGFEECYKYLINLQNNLGVMNNGLVYALYDYEAQEPDELSFKTDDELLILRRDDSQEQEWWWAQKRIKETSDSVVDIKEGYVPRNLVGLYPRVKAFKRTRISESNMNKNGNGSSE